MPLPRRHQFLMLGLAALIRAGAALAGGVDPLLPAHLQYRENAPCTEIAPPDITAMPHSEGDYAVCFSYGSADMISQRIGRAVSPIDIATGFFLGEADLLLRDPRELSAIDKSRRTIDVTEELNPSQTPWVDRMEGGEERHAIEIADARGLCPESDLPGDEGFRDYMHELYYFRFLALAQGQHKVCRKGLFGIPDRLRDPMADAANLSWKNYVDSHCHRFRSPVPLLPVTYRIADDFETLTRWKEKGWKPSAQQAREAFARIDYALDHRRYPVVGYSYEVYEKRLPGEREGDIDHSSVIVARKMMNGACHYMLQDDSGENCIKFYPKLHDRCILGRVWLSRSELLESLHSVTYLR